MAMVLKQLRFLFGLLGLLSVAGLLSAGELYLDCGLILEGTVVKVPGLNMLTAGQNDFTEIRNQPFYMVDDGVRRYFVPYQHVAVPPIDSDPFTSDVSYDLFQQKTGRSIGPAIVGAAQMEPFDKFGRRTVTLMSKGRPIHIVQGITQIRPDYAKIEGLTHVWEYNLDTRTIPPDVLHMLIENATDQASLSDRKAAVQFYLQADLPSLAQQELDRIAQDFPDAAAWCQEFRQQIFELKARLGLNELQLRRESGQHQLAYYISRQFPADQVSADVLREANDIVRDYENAIEDRDRALMLLDVTHAQLPMELAHALQPLRAVLQDELHYETLGRLRPFLQTEGDDSLSAEQKLALAYSGWLLGASEAITELPVARNLWAARFLALEYLRCDDNPFRREAITEELTNLEGVNVARLAHMVPLLPLPFEPPTRESGTVVDVEFTAGVPAETMGYSVMLPPEYSPHHHYPLLVVMHANGRTFEDSIRLWAGDEQNPGWGQRRGYIVIAPHHCEETATAHDYSAHSLQVVRRSIEHVRKRLRVDSNRIFLAGHGMGADACYDVGLSAPDLFAGAICVAGQVERHAVFLWENGANLSWYVVGGERDRETVSNNAPKLNRMMLKGQDIIYCDYKSRGFESFVEEQPRIFDWMQNITRRPLSKTMDFKIGSLRITDNQFNWVEVHDLPERLFPPVPADGSGRGIQSRPITAHIAPGGPIYVSHPGKSTTLWLAPELIDFDVRHRVSINSRMVFNSFVEPQFETLLEDLRLRGDRERLYWSKLSL
ncbi:MAG: hypothetical protein KDA90_10400 [Planctomycetaceae bacterium]|nr:hypothetical protein [Planctomycetaceae bacterium]